MLRNGKEREGGIGVAVVVTLSDCEGDAIGNFPIVKRN